MPELPEVETTLRGVTPYMQNQVITHLIIRNFNLRWPIDKQLPNKLINQRITAISRRGKYLLLQIGDDYLILHLGMSGKLCIVPAKTLANPHDHVDIVLHNGLCCRFSDPRRFGCLLWTTDSPEQHDLLRSLGPEPLSDVFTAHYLYQLSRSRTVSIKQFIMHGKVVVGIGNIYANEALFAAGIHPTRPANKISKTRYVKLVTAIKAVLLAAIDRGGTTLRDFTAANGNPGYFKQSLAVYGRTGEACLHCHTLLSELQIAQRSTVYCKRCQR